MDVTQDFDFVVIHTYTRAQALEDGVLIDVTDMAHEAGIKHPTAVSTNLYHNYIVPPLALAKEGQSIEGRLWDMLCIFRGAALRSSSDTIEFPVRFRMLPSVGRPSPGEIISITARVHPGDCGEPVITLMLPGDD